MPSTPRIWNHASCKQHFLGSYRTKVGRNLNRFKILCQALFGGVRLKSFHSRGHALQLKPVLPTLAKRESDAADSWSIAAEWTSKNGKIHEETGKSQLTPIVRSYDCFLSATEAPAWGGDAERRIFNSVDKTTFFTRCLEPSIRASKRRAAVAPS